MKQGVPIVFVSGLLLAAVSCDSDDVFFGPGFDCSVTNPVVELTLEPRGAVILVRTPARVSDALQFRATAFNRTGAPRTDVPIVFSSSDTSVATVDASGLVSAKRAGTAQISASTCGKKALSTVTVENLVATVSVRLDTGAIVAGDSTFVRAHAISQLGDTLPDVQFSFTSNPPAGVQVRSDSDNTAVIVSSVSGSFAISATGEGATGSGTLTVHPRVFLSGDETAQTLDAGGDFACGIISLGRGYCWGLHDVNQLGAVTDSTCFPERPPMEVRACSVLPKRLSTTVAFASVAAGDSSACGIDNLQRIHCWGHNEFGQLGIGSTVSAPAPTRVGALLASSITVGGAHACALDVGGIAYCWGNDSAGQLGDARSVNSTTPIPVLNGGGPAVFAQMSAGYRHTCAITSGGAAFCWGANDSLQLGDATAANRDTPVPVAGQLVFRAISAGRYHTCGLTMAGSAVCWGIDSNGQLGSGTGDSSVPVSVSVGQSFVAISSGADHTCALTAAGDAHCWGSNRDLQLGRGPVTGGGAAGNAPAQVLAGQMPAGVSLRSISAGRAHSCGVGSDGSGYCWGSNVFGALGNTLQAAFRGMPQRVATPQ